MSRLFGDSKRLPFSKSRTAPSLKCAGLERLEGNVGCHQLGQRCRAKMAKADGLVTADEVTAFKEVFKVPEGEMKNVSRIFNLAKQDIVGYEAYAKQLASLLDDVLEGLFHIALADGVFHPNEEQFLAEVAEHFGFTDTEFSYIKARHVSSAKRNPYEVLGVTPDIGNHALKIHYRKLVVDNHPDKMIARGVPPEFVTIAANEAVARERRI